MTGSQNLCRNVVLLRDPLKRFLSPQLCSLLLYLVQGKISPKQEVVIDRVKSARALRVGREWAEASGKRDTL